MCMYTRIFRMYWGRWWKRKGRSAGVWTVGVPISHGSFRPSRSALTRRFLSYTPTSHELYIQVTSYEHDSKKCPVVFFRTGRSALTRQCLWYKIWVSKYSNTSRMIYTTHERCIHVIVKCLALFSLVICRYLWLLVTRRIALSFLSLSRSLVHCWALTCIKQAVTRIMPYAGAPEPITLFMPFCYREESLSESWTEREQRTNVKDRKSGKMRKGKGEGMGPKAKILRRPITTCWFGGN